MKKSKNNLNIFLRYTCTSLSFCLLLFLCSCSSHGFTVKKISSTVAGDPRWEVNPPNSYERDKILAALDQPYIYLAKGDHCYAFISEDGKTVLKFFRQYHLGRHTWHNAIPLPNSLMSWYLKRHERHLKRRESDFTGYKNAYEHLKEETGLRFLHLNRTKDLKKKVKLIYKDKLTSEVDIDQIEFLMQDYFEVGFRPIEKLIKNGQSDLALSYCQDFLKLVARRCQKGFADRDLQLYKNFGFRDGKAYEIDVGFLTKDPNMALAENIQKDVFHVSQEISNWLHENYPDYKADFAKITAEVLASFSPEERIKESF